MNSRLRFSLVVNAVVVAFGLGTLQAREPGELIQRQAEVRKLLRAYGDAGSDHEKRAAVVAQAVKIGSPATQKLQPVIARELAKQLDGYGKAFTQVAARLSASRASAINPAEITSLRAQFRDLRRGGNLTKHGIKTKGDPIVRRLEQMLVIDRSDIFQARPELQTQRGRLEEVGALWERCAMVAYNEFLESIQDPETKKLVARPSVQEFLESEETIAARLAMPMGGRDRAVLAANARIATRLDRSEARAVLATNLLRILVGQSPCAIDLRLAAAARDHSSDMQRLKFFSHESPVKGKNKFTRRAANFGASASAENIAINGGGGAVVVRAWYHSPGHHKNMFGSHGRVGVGKAGRYWTQMFGR